MLVCENVFSGYGGVDVIKDIGFTAENGELVCVIGANGCGKSTLLKSLAALLPYRGSVRVDGSEVSSLSRKKLAKKITLLSQMSQVYFSYTVYETVALSRYVYATTFFKTLSAQDRAVVDTVLGELALLPVKNKKLDELSGGQLQRVFLARALAQEPDIILLDEPTNHLDLKHQIELLEYLSAWVKSKNKIVIGVLHDLNLAYTFFEKAVLLKDGLLCETGKTSELFTGENLKNIYDIDVRAFMLRSLQKWT
jgi:iron complex transport system ATP-binding protein